jgi:Helix-turn-helix domain
VTDCKSSDQKSLTYSIPEAGEMAGLSRNGAYAAADRGEIPTIRFGRLLRVPAAAWDRILQEGRPLPEPPSRDLPRR